MLFLPCSHGHSVFEAKLRTLMWPDNTIRCAARTARYSMTARRRVADLAFHRHQ
jgi:hypothetical protein